MLNNRPSDITTEPRPRGFCIRCGEQSHSPLPCEVQEKEERLTQPVLITPRTCRQLEGILKIKELIRGDSQSIC